MTENRSPNLLKLSLIFLSFQVCPCKYKCECGDSSYKKVACKHIHLLHVKGVVKSAVPNSVMLAENSVTDEPMPSVPSTASRMDILQQQLTDTINEINNVRWGMDSENDVADLLAKLNIAKRFALSCHSSTQRQVSLPSTSRMAPNKEMEPQVRLTCTRKRRYAPAGIYRRLTNEERDMIQEEFDEMSDE